MKLHRFAAASFLASPSIIEGVLAKNRRRHLRSDADVNIEQCLDSAEPTDFVTAAGAIQVKLDNAGDLSIPIDTGAFSTSLNKEIFPGVCPLPPSTPIPPYTLPQTVDEMVFPFIHNSPDASKWGYQKFGSVPVCLTPFLDISLADFKSDSVFTSVFAQNLEDRGTDNLRKRQYMSALSCDKLPFYEELLEAKVRQLVTELTDETNPGQPVLSTWFKLVEEFFLDIHFGQVQHPAYVKTYFNRVFRAIAGLGVGCPSDEELASAFCEAKEVKKYVQLRFDEIVANEDKSTIMYWWNEGGLPQESIVQEAIHNALAFQQFLSTPFLVIAATLFGRLAIDNLTQLLNIPGIVVDDYKINFFQEYANAGSPKERFNVNREAWRMLLPNNLWSSALQDEVGLNDEALITVNFKFQSTAHTPFLIQALNDGYDPTSPTGATNAFVYNTARYVEFQPAQGATSCPFLQGDDSAYSSSSSDVFLGPGDLSASTIDGETIIPPGHEKIIPVYETPKYCPFGLGYRRCPAEAFNYMFLDKILDIWGTELDFRFEGDPATVIELLQGVPCSDEGAVPGGIVCRRNNIFADPKDE